MTSHHCQIFLRTQKNRKPYLANLTLTENLRVLAPRFFLIQSMVYGRDFAVYAEFYHRDCFAGGAGDFSGIEPEKSLHFHRLTADENARGKNSCFSPEPPLAPFKRISLRFAPRLPRSARSSAASPRVPSATKKLFLKKKFSGLSKRLFSLRGA